MGLHINKQADLDAMLNKFAKFNPKNSSNSNQVESEKEIEDKQIEAKERNKFFKRDQSK
ncbi:SPJ_0845 family protein [Fructilactobacillus sanfranciscensis]|uniref:SPJ_0845 family protein n=1 Tax=Fructilactobacillus sanfranciscensis TaxID=1625 RepID=UPI0013D3E669|nr:SPJ_0845 family protein [Fructilactobacillus sanfranciscensis]WED57070.1 SPJ_0845 family protein [Fructilactobacillus sanfranciscensis]